MDSGIPKSEAEQYNGRVTSVVLLSCLMAASGGFIFGYDLGISGGVTSMTPFLMTFFPDVYKRMKGNMNVSNYCKFDSQLLTLFTSSLYIAALIASFFASPVTKAFGRKISILVAGIASLAGSAIGSSALNLYMLIFGRVLLGVGLGFANQAIPLYISEMALPRHRGKMNIGFELGIGIGVLIANVTNYATAMIKGGWGWRVSLSLSAVPAAVLTFCAVFLPETPNNLILISNNHQKAKKGFAFSWGPLGWLVPSEIYPLEIRSAGQSITVAVGFLLNFVVGQTFLAMLCHFKSGIFFFFAGWLAVMTAFVYFFLPETKNVPLEQMEKVWKEHWFWMKFVDK